MKRPLSSAARRSLGAVAGCWAVKKRCGPRGRARRQGSRRARQHRCRSAVDRRKGNRGADPSLARSRIPSTPLAEGKGT